MMRITDTMRYMGSQRDLARNQEMLYGLERQASSGLRVERSSDDPVAAANIVRLNAETTELEQCQANNGTALAELQTADNCLGDIGDLLIRAKELAIAMANHTYGDAERGAAAQEVRSIREQVTALANTEVNGVYIFGGYQTGTPPVDGSGTVVGDNNTRQVLAAPGLELDASISASDALAPAGGADVLAELDALANNLEVSNLSGIQAAVDQMETCHAQVNAARGQCGVLSDSLRGVEDVNEARRLQLQGDHARLAEADTVETLSQYVLAQQALNGSLEVTAQMLSGLSLVDKL